MEEYLQYNIRPDDSLQSIASLYGISVIELIWFHNEHCGVRQFLFENESFPGLHTFIYVPKSDTNIRQTEQTATFLNSFRSSSDKHYRVTLKNAVVMSGKTIAQYHTVLNWLIQYTPSEPRYIWLKEISRKQIQQDPSIALVNKLTSAIIAAISELLIERNPNGGFGAVLNQKEIIQKWEQLKFDQLKSTENSIPGLDSMLQACDGELEQLDKMVRNNLLYVLFFLPTGSWRMDTTEFMDGGEILQMLSQFFPPEMINYNFHYKSHWQEDGLVAVDIRNNFTDNSIWQNRLTQQFNEKYQKITSLPFQYTLRIEGSYRLEKSGEMHNGLIFVREMVNNDLFYTAEYEYTLQKDEEKQ